MLIALQWRRIGGLAFQNAGKSCFHYIDVIMTTMASQITSLTVVYSTVYSDADKKKHQSPSSLAFVRGIHRDRWIPRTKGQLRGKCFNLMTSSCCSAKTKPNIKVPHCLPCAKGIHRSPLSSHHKGSVIWKGFPCNNESCNAITHYSCSSCLCHLCHLRAPVQI